MSTMCSGAASRSFIIGSSEWPAGEQAGFGAEPLQQLERVVDARGPLVLERCWDLHGVPPCRCSEERPAAPGAAAAPGSGHLAL